MNQIFPHVKPTNAFRDALKQRVLAEFSLSTKSRHSLSWLKWLIPAVSLATLILVKQSLKTSQIVQLDQEMTTIEQQLLSDPELDAAIDFQEL